MSTFPYSSSAEENTSVRCDLSSTSASRPVMVNTPDKAEGNDSEQLSVSPSCTSSMPWTSALGEEKPPLTLPQYTHPIPSQWLPGQVEILHKSKALICAPLKLRNALVSSYLSWVYPFCPVIDIHAFLMGITYMDGSQGKISLLLLHSVMFAGASFAPLSELNNAGYDSRLSAKADFYFRAKLLYDFGYESDRVVLVQSLLLMSYWHDKQNSLQNHSYWIALANVVARRIGLHRNPTISMTAKDIGLWRRLGWTCFIRDRIISLGERHPPTIALRHFNLRLPEVSDFEIGTLPQEVLLIFPNCEVLQNPGSQIVLAQIFIEKVKLCIILDGIFASKDEEVAPNLGVTNEDTVALLERTLKEQDGINSEHKTRLQAWQDELPKNSQYGPSPMRALSHCEEVIRLHQSLLHILYHTAFLVLYSPREALNSTSSDSIRRCIRVASSSIAHIMEDLQSHNLIPFLPSASVAMVINVAVTKVHQYKLMPGFQKDWCIRRFLDCIWYLRQLQAIHENAEFAAEFLVHSSCKLCHPIRPLNKEQISGFGVWEPAHSPGHLLQRHSHEDSNVNMGMSNAVHAPPESVIPWPNISPEFVQQLDGPFRQYGYGYGYGWNVDLMPELYDTYHMTFFDPSHTVYPIELLDNWMAEPFRPSMNE
ncbi:hypothetical protein ETB97_008415 [Aspergillus alliaceus]|uniref:Xylanolytic transcriptional activator regulatory domain-containing protein n=1 Tax=Petromyces alliaceus TaxID=209559 RepID=A0A8H6E171_PETAA|nr:hypothetical protein ETB97_008415 [Aspergillus burnettii]